MQYNAIQCYTMQYNVIQCNIWLKVSQMSQIMRVSQKSEPDLSQIHASRPIKLQHYVVAMTTHQGRLEADSRLSTNQIAALQWMNDLVLETAD